MKSLNDIFARNTKRLLKDKGWSIGRLATELGKDKAHVSRVLGGKKRANLDFVQVVSKALDVSAAVLFKD